MNKEKFEKKEKKKRKLSVEPIKEGEKIKKKKVNKDCKAPLFLKITKADFTSFVVKLKEGAKGTETKKKKKRAKKDAKKEEAEDYDEDCSATKCLKPHGEHLYPFTV
jgi:hypothetical protein